MICLNDKLQWKITLTMQICCPKNTRYSDIINIRKSVIRILPPHLRYKAWSEHVDLKVLESGHVNPLAILAKVRENVICHLAKKKYLIYFSFETGLFIVHVVVCCCTLNNKMILWWTFIRQVSTNTGNYQLPLFHCNTLHWRRFLAPGLVHQVFCDVMSNSLLTTLVWESTGHN